MVAIHHVPELTNDRNKLHSIGKILTIIVSLANADTSKTSYDMFGARQSLHYLGNQKRKVDQSNYLAHTSKLDSDTIRDPVQRQMPVKEWGHKTLYVVYC